MLHFVFFVIGFSLGSAWVMWRMGKSEHKGDIC